MYILEPVKPYTYLQALNLPRMLTVAPASILTKLTEPSQSAMSSTRLASTLASSAYFLNWEQDWIGSN